MNKIEFRDDISSRIDKYLASELQITRSVVQKLIKEEKILVNEVPVQNNYLLKRHDEIIVLDEELSSNRHDDVIPEDIKLDIIYEDDDILVINKPKNMVVHTGHGHYSGTLVNALKFYLNDKLANAKGLRPGIVHRIDKNTTGILLIAKNDVALVKLQKQFRNHTITRKYYGIIHNNFPYEELRIDLPIGRSKRDRQKFAIVEDGKKAITIVRKIGLIGKYTLIDCELKTGRTHQIRVHLSHLKYPLLGDDVYGLKKDLATFKQGQFLCAHYLKFIHPTTSKTLEFELGIPEYFCEFINQIN